MERLRNPIRGYAWGSRSVIARMQGRSVPSTGPEAELWVGAHPADPSRLESTGQPLTALVAERPEQVLGAPVLASFGARLPYLLKLLAADAPLSLQAHPDPAQAAAGFAAEEAAGVPRDAPRRRYADPYHKPELLVAVEGVGEHAGGRFRALCGFREPADSAALLAGLGVPGLAPVVSALAGGHLEGAVRGLLTLPAPGALVAEVTVAAGLAGRSDPRYRLVGELAAAYPGDVGVVVALLLNQVTLAPGEAIFMPAGNLHAYLHGTGVEIMAASDNVLRGGLTPKHVDVPELLRVLRFAPLPEPVLAPAPVGPGVVTWPVPVPEFTLHRVRPQEHPDGAVTLELAGPRTVLCLAGRIEVDDAAAAVTLRAGEAAFGVAGAPGPAAGAEPGGAEPLVGPLRLVGTGVAYVASTAGRTSVGHAEQR